MSPSEGRRIIFGSLCPCKRTVVNGGDGDDLMMALARKIVSGEEDEAETVEAIFAQARDAESVAEELVVDGGWKLVEIEPEAVVVNGNGANGNGHHDEAPEPQQSLFSWAECLAQEQEQPQGRSRKPQPATASLFEWALGNEQESEGEPGGTGR